MTQTFNYFPNIPNPPNNPSVDVPNMQTNTNSIQSIIGVDHYPFENNQQLDGYHQQVTFGAADFVSPGFPPISTAAVFYNGVNAGNGWPHWNNSAGNVPMLTGIPVPNPNGYTYLPGGIILQYGKINSPSTSGSVSFPISFSSAPFSLTISPQATSGVNTVTISSSTPPTASGFNYFNPGAGAVNAIYWVALGT